MSRQLIALLGATASGKTAAAAAVAQRLTVEVVSADSRQLRREMQIGTAAPTEAELAAVRHHLVGIVAPDAPWTLADYLSRARQALEEIWDRGHTPLLVGGSGQYVWSLLEGRSVPAVPPNPPLRARLEAVAGAQGVHAVHARLAECDPASASRIDARNLRRVIRALEIVEATGAPVPPRRLTPPDFEWRVVGIAWPREALYARADARVERMYEAGLVDETRALINRYGGSFEALKSVGYAEAARVVAGEWEPRQAAERTRSETHRLIRQQGAWFRADDGRIDWRDGEEVDGVVDAVVAAARAPVG
jgi:tRNA dimethylallyltransferase